MSAMQLIPAIDIRNGRCVRLLQGDFEQETRYDVDPLVLAERYAELGATWMHVVDLDGAATGKPVNLQLIERIGAQTEMKIQLGGGVRDRDSLLGALGAAERVVIGSLAVGEPETVSAWIAEFGSERFTLAFDVRLAEDGEPFITTHGWTRTSEMTLEHAVERYLTVGLTHVLCTDVAKDGALNGPNIELYENCVQRWPSIQFQASGGVRNADDLADLSKINVAGAISGKALLEGKLSDEEIKRFLPSA